MSYAPICAVFVFTCWSASAICQPAVGTAPEKPEVPRLTVNVGPFFGISFGFQCHATGNDTATCASSSPVAGLGLAPRWRVFDDKLGVGFSTGITWVAQSQKLSTTQWYDGQLGARYYFGQAGPFQSWIDATCGAMLAVERLPTYLSDSGATIAAHSISVWAPAASVALGYDAEMVHGFGLAPEIRVSYFGLNHQGGAFVYNPQTVVTLGLGFVGFGFHR